ncbi:MAG: cytochrome c3 family protein [Planctomycetota bacterium]
MDPARWLAKLGTGFASLRSEARSRFARHALVLTLIAGLVVVGGCGRHEDVATARASTDADRVAQSRFPVLVNPGRETPRVATGQLGFDGQPITLSCRNCHDAREPQPKLSSADELDQFHQGLTYRHGDRPCLACHTAGDYDRLHLADGGTLAFDEVMQLCAQCHGPQARDFAHGAHGGMTGYWDLTRGPRRRNNCIDCHDPHAPALPKLLPTFKPRDRFLAPAITDEEHERERTEAARH